MSDRNRCPTKKEEELALLDGEKYRNLALGLSAGSLERCQN